ncbi:MAG: rRNA maturation RNase YbeY [Lachnospiraceae bacterium]|nr:rRNA maturation RNase YbeY [Lachnospiraceae bacterium]
MTIPITFETDDPFDFDAEALLRQVITAVLDSEDCPYECEIDVLLTDNGSIREINREERGIDAPTDVLSFPLVAFASPASFDRLEEDPTLFHPETGELMLGDMVISVDKVLSQAKEYGHSIRRELAFLAAHSSFHLLGYDHETEEERLVMEEKQETVLKELGITRE